MYPLSPGLNWRRLAPLDRLGRPEPQEPSVLQAPPEALERLALMDRLGPLAPWELPA
jgi:hypothetical protein